MIRAAGVLRKAGFHDCAWLWTDESGGIIDPACGNGAWPAQPMDHLAFLEIFISEEGLRRRSRPYEEAFQD